MKNTASKNKFLLLAIISTIVAIGVQGYLTVHFYGVKFGLLEGTSACNINAVFNCDTVTASKYAALFGVPIALWGLATNIILLFLLSVTRLNLSQDRSKTSRYAFLVSALTVLATLVMGTISLTAMSAYCIFCISAYVLSIIGFIGAWLGAEGLSASNIADDIKDAFVTDKWFLGSLIAIPVFAFVGNIMYLESHGLSEIEKLAGQKVAAWSTSPAQKFDETKGLTMQKGTMPPVMTIVEFADFRCGHCKHAAPSLHNFTQSHPDVKLVFKAFPLDGTCNEAIKGGGDGISCGLASAVMCSEKIAQKGWAAHGYIFENQMEIIQAGSLDKNLESVSKAVSIPVEDLKKCINDPATGELIRSMANEGAAAQIQGTPTVFVNSKLLSGGQMIPILESTYKAIKGN